MEKLLAILCQINPEIDYWQEKHLIDNRLYDSIQIVYLIEEISSEFEIEIEPQDMLPENFNSLDAIWKLVQKYAEG
jgi:hypothetical protein